MSKPNVKIIKGTGAFGGLVPAADGTSLLAISFDPTAYTDGTSTLTGTQWSGVSLTDFEGYNFSQTADANTEVLVHEHLKQFYAQAPAGTELHLIALAPDATMENIFTNGHAQHTLLTTYLSGQAGKIKLAAVALNPSYVEATPTAGITDDLATAIPLCQTLASAEFDRYRPISFVLEGRNYTAASAAVATDLRSLQAGSVSVYVGRDANRRQQLEANWTTDTLLQKYADVGTMLGRLAAIPVQRNVGRVLDGPIGYVNAELTGGQLITETTVATQDALNTKGYIFATMHAGISGFYFNDDHTCAAADYDFRYIALNRVIDKAARIVRRVYLSNLLDEIAVDPETGKLAGAVVKALETTAQTTLEDEMVLQGEAVAATVTIDPNQDVLTTDNIDAQIGIVPYGIARTITATLKLTNPST